MRSADAPLATLVAADGTPGPALVAGQPVALPGLRSVAARAPGGGVRIVARAASGAHVERDGRRRTGLFLLADGARLRDAAGAVWTVRVAERRDEVAAAPGRCRFCRSPIPAGAPIRVRPDGATLCAPCAAADVAAGRERSRRCPPSAPRWR
jgi:hypothetical protein